MPVNPSERPASSRIVQLIAGYAHSMWAMADGCVWAAGRNDSGQCGIAILGATAGDIDFPLQVPIAPGLYSPPTAIGPLASSSFLLRTATKLTAPPKHPVAKTYVTTKHGVRLHTPPLPRAIVYDDPEVVLLKTSSRVGLNAKAAIPPLKLQPSELKELLARKDPSVIYDF